MGRKAKLKKQRRAERENPKAAKAQPKYDDTHFVEEFQRQGHQIIGGERSPDIPQSRPEPEV